MEKLKIPIWRARSGALLVSMFLVSQVATAAVEWEGRIGYFVPSEDALLTVYGTGLAYGGAVSLWSTYGWGIGFDVSNFRKTGEFLNEEKIGKISITSINATLLWIDRNIRRSMVGRRVYLGLGGGIYMVDEEVRPGFERFRVGVSEDSAFGFYLVSGISVAISPSTALTHETRFSLAEIDGDGGLGGTKVNLGGYTIFLGLRF